MNNSEIENTNEEERLHALRAYQILDTLSEAEYDDLTELASEIIGTPISLISLVDENRQWFKSKKGISLTETDRTFSFCAHAIMDNENAFIVEDARKDERFRHNPYVTSNPNIVFYAGIPLIDVDHYALGTLCVIDNKPRKITSKQIKSLQTIAKQVVRLIESRKTHRELGENNVLLSEALSVNNGFYLILDKNAKIVNFGNNFKSTLHGSNTSINFYDYFEFEGGFDFEKYRLNEIKDDKRLKFFKVKNKHQRFKCSLRKIKDAIIIVSSPVINSEYTLKNYDLTLNDFAPHDYIAEYLFLQQSTQRSLKDTQNLTSKLIERNKELEKAQLNIDALSRFPDENPNPVLRFDFYYHLIYSNESSQKFFLNDFGISENDIEDVSFKLLLSEMIGPNDRFEQRILERNNRHYSITLKTVSQFNYINLYVSDITSFILRVRSNELALIDIKEQINEQREFYEFILNNIPADIAVFSKDHKYVYVNPQGIKNPELRQFIIGKDDFDYCRFKGIPDDMAQNRRVLFNTIIQNKEFVNWEDEIKDSQGNRVTVYRRMGPLFNANGEIEYIIGYGINITDRKIAEENLIAANNRLNLLEKFIDNTNDSIQVADESGQLIYINKKASERLGISAESVYNYSVLDFENTISSAEQWHAHLDELKAKHSIQIEGVNKNLTTNQLIDVEVNINYEIIDGKGYVIAASRDITDRKRTQQEINRLSLVAKNTNNGVLILDTDRKITWANDAMLKRSEYTIEELIGRSPRVFQFEKTDKTTVEKIYQSLVKLEPISEEILHVSKNGNEYWINLNIMPIKDDEDNHIGFIAIEFDITERKRFEDEIEQMNVSLEQKVIEETQKNITLAKTLSDQEKLVTLGEISSGIAHDLNTPLGAIKSGAESIRYTLENLFKDTIRECSDHQINVACEKAVSNDAELFIGGLQFIKETRSFENFLKTHFTHIDSEIITSSAEKFVKARIQTEEIELIKDVLSSQNPLQYLELIYQLKMVRTFIDTILKSSEKAARVIQDLRSFIKNPKNNAKSSINLHQNISTVLNIFNFELKRTANVEFEVGEKIEVEAYDIKLFQLWSNLIKNAIEAMEESEERGLLKIYSSIEQNYVNIVIENNGPKIPEEIQNEIFNKFYTTKSSKNGTGLGLNIVKNIIEDHDARIKLESTNESTKFIITFNKL
jgi:PAS domain S-box-containing protein